jgi:hypothetical protein
LPVEYSYFEATLVEGQGVRLDWATASETRNNGFEIQRSTDGIHFEAIQMVASRSVGGQGQDYVAWDAQPQPGSNWYRLRQMDMNGLSSLSEVRVIVAGQGEFELSQVYPNPVSISQSLHVNVYAGAAGELRMVLRDMTGRAIAAETRSVTSGMNELELPIGKLATGSYLLEVQGQAGRRAVRRFNVLGE